MLAQCRVVRLCSICVGVLYVFYCVVWNFAWISLSSSCSVLAIECLTIVIVVSSRILNMCLRLSIFVYQADHRECKLIGII